MNREIWGWHFARGLSGKGEEKTARERKTPPDCRIALLLECPVPQRDSYQGEADT